MDERYDINKFMGEVEQLLHQAGVAPRAQSDPKPVAAAGMLLRAYGLTPVMDHVDALRRSTDQPWPDSDDAIARSS